MLFLYKQLLLKSWSLKKFCYDKFLIFQIGIDSILSTAYCLCDAMPEVNLLALVYLYTLIVVLKNLAEQGVLGMKTFLSQ